MDIDATRAIVKSIIQYQRKDATFGKLFVALYRYCDRLSEAKFSGELPTVIMSFSSNDTVIESKQDTHKGWFVSQDGLCLPYRINLNLSVMTSGLDAVEVLTHEVVHAWQFSRGIWNSNNYHDEEWHSKMSEIGIETNSRFGDTVDFNETWNEWMQECEDLALGSFLLPGAPKKEEPQQLEFTKKEK